MYLSCFSLYFPYFLTFCSSFIFLSLVLSLYPLFPFVPFFHINLYLLLPSLSSAWPALEPSTFRMRISCVTTVFVPNMIPNDYDDNNNNNNNNNLSQSHPRMHGYCVSIFFVVYSLRPKKNLIIVCVPYYVGTEGKERVQHRTFDVICHSYKAAFKLFKLTLGLLRE